MAQDDVDMPIFTSQTELARSLGVSQASVSRRLKHSDCPVHRIPPWTRADADALMKWTMKDSESSREVARAIQQAKLDFLTKKAQLLDLQLAQSKGTLIDRQEQDDRESRRIIHLRDTLLGLGDEVAPHLAGRDAETIRTALLAKMTDICLMYAEKLDEPRGMAEIIAESASAG